MLEAFGKLKLGEFHEVESFRPGHHVGRNQPDEHHRAANEGVQREFHRAVFLARRSPDRDEKIFRNNGQFVEHEEQE